jgi:hypothetical protein
MNQTSTIDHQRVDADGRREALQWLARRLKWERRLGELRPHDTETSEIQTKKAA